MKWQHPMVCLSILTKVLLIVCLNRLSTWKHFESTIFYGQQYQ